MFDQEPNGTVREDAPPMAPLRPTPPPADKEVRGVRNSQPADREPAYDSTVTFESEGDELPPSEHDVGDPMQNMRDICKHAILVENYLLAPDLNPIFCARKHCVLVEIHLIDPKRRCPDCIAKHLLAVDSYLDEVLAVFPRLAEVSPFSDAMAPRVFDAWKQGTDPAVIANAVKGIRNTLELITSAFNENNVLVQVEYPSCIFRHLDAMEGYAEEISTLDNKRHLQSEVETIVPKIRGLRNSLNSGVSSFSVAQSMRGLRKSLQPMVVNNGKQV